MGSLNVSARARRDPQRFRWRGNTHDGRSMLLWGFHHQTRLTGAEGLKRPKNFSLHIAHDFNQPLR